MKKKIFAVVLTSLLLFALLSGVGASASTPITVLIEGQQVSFTDQNPTVIDGRTLVPVRGVFEELGFSVDWDPTTSQVTLRGGDVVVITIGSNVFTTNGVSRELDVPAQTIGGRTMLPLRLVLESVGYYLGWDAATATVLISSQPDPVLPTGFTPTPTPTPTPTTPPHIATQGLVGTWNWLGMEYYVFNANGTGTMMESPIRWTASGNILSICATPDACGDRCIAPSLWYFIISGDQLTLTSTITPDLTFNYTAG